MLTKSEKEIFDRLYLPIEEIAKQRFVSLTTVKTQLASMRRKFNVHSTQELVQLSYKIRIAEDRELIIKYESGERKAVAKLDAIKNLAKKYYATNNSFYRFKSDVMQIIEGEKQ